MSSRDQSADGASERTPLIARDEESHPESISDSTSNEPKKKTNRLPSFIALGILCVAVILAIIFGFATPAAVEEYAREAITFEPTDLSINSFTDSGLLAQVQGVFYLDGSKVKKKSIRDLGRAGTWIAKEVEIKDAEVEVYLPEYDEVLLGTVRVPSIIVNIRNGHRNFINILSDVTPGDVKGLRRVAHDVLDGKRKLDVKAVATVSVKSGLFSLGTQSVTSFMSVEAGGNAKMPDIDIAHLKVGEFGGKAHPQGIKATADVTAMNPYPVKFDVPPLAFEIMLPDCSGNPVILGMMQTDVVRILPRQNVTAGVTGYMRQLPTSLTQACPGSQKSPLDNFIGSYLDGNDTTIYVKGGQQDLEQTPAWIGDILKETTVPVPVPAQPLDNKDMIKDFSLADVHFSLPDFGNSSPRISAIVNVVVGLPKDINIDVSVSQVRADADVFYKGTKLGELDLSEWQTANSTKIDDELHVRSVVKDAPLTITNQDVFTDVLQAMLFGGNGIELSVHADVDVNSATVLGEFVVRRIPAEGKIFVKPLGGTSQFKHNITDISVVGSTANELIMQAKVDVKNPTDYSAHIPYFNISLLCNETLLGYAWGSFDVRPGKNKLVVKTSYAAGPVGAELLSQYISGWNTTLTLRTHEGSAPGLPDPRLSIDVPMPHMFGKFLRETTMHVFSSTATFVLFSPLPMYVTSIDAMAYYNGTNIGEIIFNEVFEIKVGENLTPRLPVDWNLDGGFGLIKHALGGDLKLDAHADVGVRIGEWEQSIWYEAKGMGAKVRF